MAKIAFSKLGCKVNNSATIIHWQVEDKDYEIEVLEYLPMIKRLQMVSNIVNYSADNNGYYNPMKVEIYAVIEAISAYTNITFTDKQKEDPSKLYDLLVSSGLFEKVNYVIDFDSILGWVNEIIHSVYEYKNSIMGILDTINTDYSNLDLDARTIAENLSDPENLTLVKDIISKLG